LSTPPPSGPPSLVDPPPTPIHPTPPSTPPATDLLHLLRRPPDQRRREFQYRFAQSAVFGLPVLALQYYGHALGGPEAGRWVAILQGLLTGWILYVGAAGMLFEGIVWLLRRRLTADLLPSAAAVAIYLFTLLRLLNHRPPLFHLCVILIGLWTGLRWLAYARRTTAAA
jgi:cation transport ATPase